MDEAEGQGAVEIRRDYKGQIYLHESLTETKGKLELELLKCYVWSLTLYGSKIINLKVLIVKYNKKVESSKDMVLDNININKLEADKLPSGRNLMQEHLRFAIYKMLIKLLIIAINL